jgi:hypothetical protein
MTSQNQINLHKNIDVFTLDSSDFERTAEGYLNINALMTRVGIFKYQNNDGTIVRQYRPAEEVLSEDSYSTLSNVPVTNEHPKEFVNSKNVKKYQVGFVRDCIEVVDNKYLKGKLVIQDDETINEIISNKKVEVSCGYTCIHEQKDGEFENEGRFDLIQRQIRYNHLAIVYKGRAGNQVKLTYDSADSDLSIMITDELKDQLENQKEDQNCVNTRKKMETIILDGVSQEVSADFKAKYDALQNSKQVADQADKIESLQKELDSLQAEYDSAKEKVEKLEIEVKEYDSAISERNKLDLVAEAMSKGLIKDGDIEIADMSELEIKKAILKKNEVKMSRDSEVYIEGRYEDFILDCDDVEEKEEEKIVDFSDNIIEKRDSKPVSLLNEDSRMYAKRLREMKEKKRGGKR